MPRKVGLAFGLLTCVGSRGSADTIRNSFAKGQIRTAFNRLTDWMKNTRLVKCLAHYTRKRRWKDAEPLAGIIQRVGCVPGNYALGEAGLRGRALILYRLLKHGALPNSLLGQFNIHLYG